MPRQSISFTAPNDEWLKSQVDSQESTSKSEVVNDLIRRAREREMDYLREKLIRAEQSGSINGDRKQILETIKEKAGINGEKL